MGASTTGSHGTTRGVLRSTYEATATSLASMRGPGGGRPSNGKHAAVEAIPSGQVARGGANVWGERSTRATPDRRQKKPPTRKRLWGQAPRRRHWHPSPRKAPQEQSRQVAWLAAHPYALRLPKGSPLSGLCRVRSAHSCGTALVLHQLPCSQHPAARHPGFLRPVNWWCTIPPSPVACKSNCAAGAVRVVHTPSRHSRAPDAPGEQAGSVALCRPVVLVFGITGCEFCQSA